MVEAVELAGLDLGASDSVELLASDPSTARALFDGVPAARLLARTRVGRDERDLLVADNQSRPTFTFDVIVARVCQSPAAVWRVKQAIARHARAASMEGALPAQDATIATLVFAVAIAPSPDASMAEAFVESTTKGLQVAAMLEIAASIEGVRHGAIAYDARLDTPDPRGALFETCVRLASSASAGPIPASRLLDASRRLYRAGLATPLLKAGPALYPPNIDADLSRRARRMTALDRGPLEALAKRDPRELAAAVARAEAAQRDAGPSSGLRLDSLLADIASLVKYPGEIVLSIALPPPPDGSADAEANSTRPSWQPHEWGSAEAAQDLATALERGTATVPRAFALVQRGGDGALDAIGAEMLRIEAHPFASAAFAEIVARRARARDVTRLVTYFAIAPDPSLAARTLGACSAPELPSMLRTWLESMLPQDGTSIPFRNDPASSAARLHACIRALRPYPSLYEAVSPLLERISGASDKR